MRLTSNQLRKIIAEEVASVSEAAWSSKRETQRAKAFPKGIGGTGDRYDRRYDPEYQSHILDEAWGQLVGIHNNIYELYPAFRDDETGDDIDEVFEMLEELKKMVRKLGDAAASRGSKDRANVAAPAAKGGKKKSAGMAGNIAAHLAAETRYGTPDDYMAAANSLVSWMKKAHNKANIAAATDELADELGLMINDSMMNSEDGEEADFDAFGIASLTVQRFMGK